MNTNRLKGSSRAASKRKSRRAHTRWAISKHELAMQYSPGFTPRGARKRLTNWINYCKPLVNALGKTGYNERQHYFSRRQLSLIYRYLGTP